MTTATNRTSRADSRPPATAGHVTVCAPSRLHFGMLSFGQPECRQFGGVGAMVDAPGWKLELTADTRFAVEGPASERVRRFAALVASNWKSVPRDKQGLPTCSILVRNSVRSHVGLGSGTQLGMAVAAGLQALYGGTHSATELARAVGRGERSAIGLHGFSVGGLLVEGGKFPGQTVSPLLARVALPAEWRFVLICPLGEQGLFGDAERKAFGKLPPVPSTLSAELCREVLLELLPSACDGDFVRFSQSLYRYGHLAGICFATQQGGPYAEGHAARMVDWLRGQGVEGVGQSSWGPLVFALLPDESLASQLVASLTATPAGHEVEVWISPMNSTGGRIETR